MSGTRPPRTRSRCTVTRLACVAQMILSASPPFLLQSKRSIVTAFRIHHAPGVLQCIRAGRGIQVSTVASRVISSFNSPQYDLYSFLPTSNLRCQEAVSSINIPIEPLRLVYTAGQADMKKQGSSPAWSACCRSVSVLRRGRGVGMLRKRTRSVRPNTACLCAITQYAAEVGRRLISEAAVPTSTSRMRRLDPFQVQKWTRACATQMLYILKH